jgi:acyl-CoA thioesterase
MPERGLFDDETRTDPAGESVWAGHVHPSWNIGDNPNGGYLMTLAVSAIRQACPQHPDPLSITVHYLRPGAPGADCRIDVQVLRAGRTLSTVRASLVQEGTARIEVLAAMGLLGEDAEPALALPVPAIPGPEACTPRTGEVQGLDLAILRRLDIRLDPAEFRVGGAGQAQISGWIRFRDGRAPDPLACLLFVDTFPPSVVGLLGDVGWVPTVELTVQLRARPAPGWMLGRFQTRDLSEGRLVEDAALWDSRGRLVAQARQLALVRRAERKP